MFSLGHIELSLHLLDVLLHGGRVVGLDGLLVVEADLLHRLLQIAGHGRQGHQAEHQGQQQGTHSFQHGISL
jgi:hypothetical protein